MTHEELVQLHIKCAKLTSDDLLPMVIHVQMNNGNAKLIEIFKTYLVRALIREGFR